MDCQTVERENIAERYLSGTLDAKLKEEWEQHYFDCDRCAELLETWQSIDKPLRQMAGSIRQEIRPRTNRSRWVLTGAAIAAALLIGLGAKMTISSGGNGRTPATAVATPASPNWTEIARLDPPAYLPPTLRDAAPSGEVQFHEAMKSYVRHDYPQAIAGLKTALQTDPDAAAPRFFLGACEILTGDIAGGAKELERISAGDSPFADEARFDLAKAYLLEGDRSRGLDVLRRLAESTGDFQGKARDLMVRVVDAR